MLYIKHCLLILPLFVAIYDIWLPRLTYGAYLVLFLKSGATHKENLLSHLSYKRWRGTFGWITSSTLSLFLSPFTLSFVGQTNNLQKGLGKAISQRSLLLVLDDFAAGDILLEEHLKPPLCSSSRPGSCILLTSRSTPLASVVSTLQPYQL